MLKDQGDALAPGRIYEVREALGEMVISDIGPSAIKTSIHDSKIDVCWGHSLDQMLEYGKHWLFTEAEAKDPGWSL